MIDKYLALVREIERYGFEVIEGTFTLADGTLSPVFIKPTDHEQLVFAAAMVYTDRNYIRNHQKLDPAVAARELARTRHPAVKDIQDRGHPG